LLSSTTLLYYSLLWLRRSRYRSVKKVKSDAPMKMPMMKSGS
jgi:hypothetical protein